MICDKTIDFNRVIHAHLCLIHWAVCTFSQNQENIIYMLMFFHLMCYEGSQYQNKIINLCIIIIISVYSMVFDFNDSAVMHSSMWFPRMLLQTKGTPDNPWGSPRRFWHRASVDRHIHRHRHRQRNLIKNERIIFLGVGILTKMVQDHRDQHPRSLLLHYTSLSYTFYS